MVVLLISVKQVHFLFAFLFCFVFVFALNLNSGRRHDIGSHSSVSHDEQKKMSHDVVHSSATHADLLRDVTDTDC